MGRWQSVWAVQYYVSALKASDKKQKIILPDVAWQHYFIFNISFGVQPR